jgi:hypothetical protein
MDLKEREIRRCWNTGMTVEEAAKHLTLQRRCRVEDPIEASKLVAERFDIYEYHLGDKRFPSYCLMGGYFSDKSGIIAKEMDDQDPMEGLASRNSGTLRTKLREARSSVAQSDAAPISAGFRRLAYS